MPFRNSSGWHRAAGGWGRKKPPPGTPIDVRDPITLAMQGAYLLGEGGGSLAINSVPSAPNSQGTVYVVGSAWGAGRGGAAFSGNGTSTYIDLNSAATPAALSMPGQCTIFALIYPTSAIGPIATDENAGNSAGQWGLRMNGTLRLTWGGVAYIQNTALTLNTWQSVAGIRSGSTGAWNAVSYINGLFDTTQGAAVNPSAPQGARIGSRGGLSQFFPGKIEHVFLWGRALSAAEIWRLHAAPYSFFTFPRRRSINGSSGTTTVTAGYSVPAEWLASLAQVDTISLEWLASLAAGESIAVEWLGGVQAGATLPAEWLLAVSVNQTAIAEWLSSASNGATTCVEWLSTLQALGVVPVEWTGVSGQPDAVWISGPRGQVWIATARGQVFQARGH